MQAFQRWKNCENRLRFDKFAVIDLGSPVFMGHGVFLQKHNVQNSKLYTVHRLWTCLKTFKKTSRSKIAYEPFKIILQ